MIFSRSPVPVTVCGSRSAGSAPMLTWRTLLGSRDRQLVSRFVQLLRRHEEAQCDDAGPISKTFLNRRVGKNGKGWIECCSAFPILRGQNPHGSWRDSTIRQYRPVQESNRLARLTGKIQLPANCANKTRMRPRRKCPHQTVDLILGVEGFEFHL